MTMNKVLAVGTAVAAAAVISVSASSQAVAAPIGATQLALKNAVVSDVVDVSRRGRRNTAIGLGVLGGLALGGALAHGAYAAPSPYYYTSPAPPPPQRCWVQTGPYRGQGYWAYC